jgi:hypothetical protein
MIVAAAAAAKGLFSRGRTIDAAAANNQVREAAIKYVRASVVELAVVAFFSASLHSFGICT